MSLSSSKLSVNIIQLVVLASYSSILKILDSENRNDNVTINSELVLIGLPF